MAFNRSLFIAQTDSFTIKNTIAKIQANVDHTGIFEENTDVNIYEVEPNLSYLITSSCESEHHKDDVYMKMVMNDILRGHREEGEPCSAVYYMDDHSTESTKRVFLESLRDTDRDSLYSFTGMESLVPATFLQSFLQPTESTVTIGMESGDTMTPETTPIDYTQERPEVVESVITEPEVVSTPVQKPSVSEVAHPSQEKQEKLLRLLEQIERKYGDTETFLQKIDMMFVLFQKEQTRKKEEERLPDVVETPEETDDVTTVKEPPVVEEQPVSSTQEDIEKPDQTPEEVPEITSVEPTEPEEAPVANQELAPVTHTILVPEPSQEAPVSKEINTESMNPTELFQHILMESHNDTELWEKMLAHKESISKDLFREAVTYNLYEKKKYGNEVLNDFSIIAARSLVI